MSLLIKPAVPDDVPAIISLQEKIWEPTYRAILSADQIAYMFQTIYASEALHRQMTEQQHTFLLLYDGPNLVGFAAYSRTDPTEERYKLHKLYVLPSEQGRGSGRRLLEEVVQRCTAAGGMWLSLNVNRYNPALRFYERVGFVIVREEDIPIGSYWMNDYVMEKKL